MEGDHSGEVVINFGSFNRIDIVRMEQVRFGDGKRRGTEFSV